LNIPLSSGAFVSDKSVPVANRPTFPPVRFNFFKNQSTAVDLLLQQFNSSRTHVLLTA
jgi:hypothetical protein